MILSDKDIKQLVNKGKIKIDPMPDWETQLGPASIDFKLGKDFKVFNHSTKPYIDPKDPETFKGLTRSVVVSEEKSFVLQPSEFVLGVTFEKIALPDDIGARIEGRSSWGRLGLIVHSTAGYIDPGFEGTVTLELCNIGKLPILLYPGSRICQLAFERMSTPVETPYSQKKDVKYQGQVAAQESRIHKDM